ncbi:MAG: alpha/beta fold hydrolase [Rhizobiaceae bacterium]|nr:alpha/beta fold hydrolase [Rhizobiaceae bacterium]
MNRLNDASLELADMGSFHVGGRVVHVSGRETMQARLSADSTVEHDPNGEFWIEQSYVQYFIPKRQSVPVPVLLVHGGGLTGACWETTPDGRPGWLHLLLREGFPVYVTDIVERGRSGFSVIDGEWPQQPFIRGAQDVWTSFRFGTFNDFDERRPFEKLRFPIGAFDQLMKQIVPRWTCNTNSQVAALRLILDRIGPAILIGHSQGGGLVTELAEQAPDLAAATVLLEPHGGPDPSDRTIEKAGPRCLVVGDYIDRSPLWMEITPIFRHRFDTYRKKSERSILIDLPASGVFGNSHMMMMEENNDYIVSQITTWLRNTLGT